jgi:hypothetical protein
MTLAGKKAKWPQNRGMYAYQPTHFEFMDLGRTLRGQCHGGAIVRPRCTEYPTLRHAQQSSCACVQSEFTIMDERSTIRRCFPKPFSRAPRCLPAAAWSGGRPNDTHAFGWGHITTLDQPPHGPQMLDRSHQAHILLRNMVIVWWLCGEQCT